jgi:glutamine synthetase
MTASTRHEAVRSIAHEAVIEPENMTEEPNNARIPEYFGKYVFNARTQKQRLPAPVYEALRKVIDTGAPLTAEIADSVASAMKDWAIENGATHYTHWFQPMTGSTAEKHDSFLKPTADGGALLEFSGSQLFQGEPDASSFPSGGLRATFEARGYTAWDPTSPAFLRCTPEGATLTIPTAFCSWTGAALDKKTPLLRSSQALSKAATRLLQMIGENQVTRASSSGGIEQEYFLIDADFFNLRPDLLACGRTLFGARPYKGQEFDDHYFGNIPSRVLRFMHDLEHELWLLGIPAKTRHNEVAPSQFELAPVYMPISISTDHNMLTMALLKEIAERHGFAALLHEKPFAGLNGSGKHLNWSVADNLGNNLFDPGKTPHENLKFILFMTAVTRGVDLHQDLLRSSIASAANDYRLGANEAPPAIMSIFLGTHLEGIVDSIIAGNIPEGSTTEPLRLGVTSLPELPRDISDRNRTSPLAFTGNRFEFRAVGSNQSPAYPATFLNTILAESLEFLSDTIEATGGPSTENIQKVVRETLSKHRRILFSGDNYTAEWSEEAARRGLLELKGTPEALEPLRDPKNEELFNKMGVFTAEELESRWHVQTEIYSNKINVEAMATRDLAMTMLLPAAMEHQKRLAESIHALQAVMGEEDTSPQKETLALVTKTIGDLKNSVDALLKVQERWESDSDDLAVQAIGYRNEVLPAMEQVRGAADFLERLVDDSLWPLPKYREMMFIR